MANIPLQLFSWREVFTKSDIQRLKNVLDNIPDEELMKHLERERGNGRNDYPIRAIWNSVIAGIVYGHQSTESLRRELMRNGELRQACGFNVFLGAEAVPTASAYTRFLNKLSKYQNMVDEIFNKSVNQLTQMLGDFGKDLAIDSKAISSYGKVNKKKAKDGRREKDADWGVKTYKGERADGSMWKIAKRWFGYKVHVFADTKYELPVAYKVTRASVSDSPQLKQLLEHTEQKHPEILTKCENLSADKGYDSAENNKLLWEKYCIKPIIANRMMAKDGEQTRSLYPEKVDNIVYDEHGVVYCVCPVTGKQYAMAHIGFEKKRNSIKYRCPAAAYGFKCKGRLQCGNGCSEYGRIVRVPLATDRRIFTPLARSSYAWKRAYKKRTAVERINSRLDGSFGFENHFIRGMKKMQLRMAFAMIVMTALAVGHVREKRYSLIRSLVRWKAAG